MSKWIIAKEFAADYGHRVWTQELDEELSCGHPCVCRHLHGHRATIIVHLEGDKLDKQGMVTDFHHLAWFKKFIDDVIDHKMILDINDPLLSTLLPHVTINSSRLKEDNIKIKYHKEGYYTLKGWEELETHFQELYEGIVIVDFVPTSENLATWLHQIIQRKMKDILDKTGAFVKRVQFYETPKSQSNFII